MVKPITPESVPTMKGTRWQWQIHEYASPKQIGLLKHLLNDMGYSDDNRQHAIVNNLLQTKIDDWQLLSKRTLSYLIETLQPKGNTQ